MMKTAIVLSAIAIVGIQAQGKGQAGPPGGGGGPPSGGSGGPKGKGGSKGGGGASSNFDIGSFLGGVVGAGNLGGVLSGLSAITSQGSVPMGPAPKGCSAYEVMFARGTFEPGPFGVVVGDPLMNTIAKDMRGQDVRGYAVQYPASMGGADTGINDIVNRVKTKAKECPNMKFSLVGYSQGGMVVSAAATRIPAELRSKVTSMVLYGSGNGATVSPPEIKQRTMANCAPNDMCGNPSGAIGHLTYGSTGTSWHARSSKYIMNAFHGQVPGYKVEMSPN